MKPYQTILFAFIMIMVCSVGYGKASPPKNMISNFSTISVVNDNAAISSQLVSVAPFVIVSETTVVNIYSNAKAADIAISEVSAITRKVICLPAPKATQLSRYIHYNVITNYSIKKIEPRARSSDILNQNKRC